MQQDRSRRQDTSHGRQGWDRFWARIGGALLFALLCLPAPLVAAPAMMVLASKGGSGEEMAPGSFIPGDTELALAEGEQLRLLGPDKTIRTLIGPWRGKAAAGVAEEAAADAAAQADLQVLARLFQAPHTNTRSQRGEDEADLLPDPWAVSVERSGSRCIREDQVQLWRRDASTSGRVNIRFRNPRKKVWAEWDKGDNLLPVPGKLFSNGQTYLVENDGRLVQLRFSVLPEGLSGAVDRAVWMAKSGCDAQAMVLLQRLE